MRNKKLFLSLCIVIFNLNMVVNAQAVKVQATRIDNYLQTAIRGNAATDVLDVVMGSNITTPSPSNADLIWGAYYQAQPNNPGLLSLTTCGQTFFTVKANGRTGIFNSNPGVALEVGSSSSIQQAKISGSLVLTSDARMKENIRDISNSLGKLKQLRSVSYNFKEDEKEEPISEKFLKGYDGDIEKLKAEIKNTPKSNAYLLSRTFFGFLAQDVEKLFPDLVFKDSAGLLSVDYIGIIPLLLDGLKEQQTQIEKQQIQLEEQKELINQLIKAVGVEKPVLRSADSGTEENEKSGIESVPLLMQNTPNPFNQVTEIGYYIPETVGKANIYIYDINGFQQKSISITERGKGVTVLQATVLRAGIYFYTLICDGEPVDTKQMILTR